MASLVSPHNSLLRINANIITMKQIVNFILTSFFSLLVACKTDTTPTTVNVIDNNQLPSKDTIKSTLKREAFEVIRKEMYQELNATLAVSTKKINAKEIVQMYYPAKVSDKTSFEKIEIKTKQKGTQTIVTLTHDNQSEHIRVQGHRIVMTLEQKGTQWQIVSIKQQFKCWIRENKTLWSNDKCS